MARTGELSLAAHPAHARSGFRGLEWCALIAVVLHLGLVQWAGDEGGRPPLVAMRGERPAVFQVRTVASDVLAQRGSEAEPPEHELAPHSAPTANATLSKPEAGPVQELPPAAPPAPRGGDGDESYLPRSMLSAPPRALDMINVPYPEVRGDSGHHVVKLWLYIDETGLVQRVVAEPGDVPLPLVEAARRSFLSARFEAGQAEGRPVRSRIHIEVRFDATPVRP
jgi:hypothetical protein